jgi:hypothetical protein
VRLDDHYKPSGESWKLVAASAAYLKLRVEWLFTPGQGGVPWEEKVRDLFDDLPEQMIEQLDALAQTIHGNSPSLAQETRSNSVLGKCRDGVG